jgi:hypothetical protein
VADSSEPRCRHRPEDRAHGRKYGRQREHQLLLHQTTRRKCLGEAGSTICRPSSSWSFTSQPSTLGAGFAWLAFKRELALLGSAFTLFAAAELVYMTYHLDWTVFLFAHTVAEVLDLPAFVLVFAAAVYSAVRRPSLGVSGS